MMLHKRKESPSSSRYIGSTWVFPVRAANDMSRKIRDWRNDSNESSSSSSSRPSAPSVPSDPTSFNDTVLPSRTSLPKYHWRYESTNTPAPSFWRDESSSRFNRRTNPSLSTSNNREEESSSSSSSSSSSFSNDNTIMGIMDVMDILPEIRQMENNVDVTQNCNCDQQMNESPVMNETMNQPYVLTGTRMPVFRFRE